MPEPRERIALLIELPADHPHPWRRLAGWLKLGLRRFGIKLVQMRSPRQPAAPGSPPPARSAAPKGPTP
jgi:hypothetical protein